jgi:hypothetical protein
MGSMYAYMGSGEAGLMICLLSKAQEHFNLAYCSATSQWTSFSLNSYCEDSQILKSMEASSLKVPTVSTANGTKQ